ncbi:MAG TPA: hypothetical protein VGI99_11765 [Gemmataceae bacterium]|jgi:hypothetical protein
MGITLLIAAGAALSLSALYVLATRTAPALAGENTLVGLHDPAAETLVGGTASPAGAGWQLATVDDLTDAEQMLDSLEASGYQDRELVVLGNSCFAVRWR